MKRSAMVLAAIAVLALAPQLVMAQRPGGGGGRGFGGGFGRGFGSPLMLLTQESVQEELGLTDEQNTKIAELADKQRESFEGLRDLSREERMAKLDESMKATNAALAEILSAEQLKRVKQIGWQRRGPSALSESEVAEALKLTDDQKTKVGEALEAAGSEMRELGREGSREEFQEIQSKLRETLLAVLTDEQREAWKSLLGEEFKGEINFPRFGRGAGGEGGGRRRNNDDN